MAECSYSRCVAEKRIIRKHLHRWTKNMVQIVGLERIAEELMGRRRWQHYHTSLLPQYCSPSDLQMEEEKDWTPVVSDKCVLCPCPTDKPTPRESVSSLPRPASESGSISSANSEESTLDDRGDTPPPSTTASAMTTFESVINATSMAASLAAVAAFSNPGKNSGTSLYPSGHPLFPPWYLPTPNNITETLRLEAIPSSVLKSESPMTLPTSSSSEQPLDLSAKSSTSLNSPSETKSNSSDHDIPSLQHLIPSASSPQSPRVPILSSHQQIFKAKPRLSAVAGRRTYTEEELQAALQDIQSGKLGTRRAAVIYGIPRSTLRNKVYKLSLERQRDSHLGLNSTSDLVSKIATNLGDSKDDFDPNREDDDDEEQELSGAEEEREVEKTLMKPLISVEDLIRFSAEGPAAFSGSDSLRALLQQGSKFIAEKSKREDTSDSPPVYPMFPPNSVEQLWTGLDQASLAPYLTQLIAASGGNLNAAALLGQISPFLAARSRLSLEERSQSESASEFVPKFPPQAHLSDLVRRMMAEEKLLLDEQQKKDPRSFQVNGSRPTEPRPTEPRPSSSSTPNKEMSEDNSASNVILKIPSFKPASKNGVALENSFPSSDFPLGVKVSSAESTQQSVISPPIGGTRSESSSPPQPPPIIPGRTNFNMNFKEVIAKSISQKFQQPPSEHIPSPSGIDFRRGLFNPGLGNSPIIRNHNNNHVEDRKMLAPNKSVGIPGSNASSSGSTTGGKGTRPKRGKYRNYDRDSLVEAVRAVQRGEMSVHRAGSYYGVPHSTLEYKVKERHLMRPRKREPKPQQLDETKRKDDSNVLRISPSDKPKPMPPKPKTPFTPPNQLPTTPNGLKMPPIFDPSIAYSAGPPFPFWPPNPFHHLPIDYARGSNFQQSPEQFFASQMIQRIQQEDCNRSSQSPTPAIAALGKSAREVAESLYDGTGANGSFLDGIIRSSLETGLTGSKDGGNGSPEHISNKNLLEQLCRTNSRLSSLTRPPMTSQEGSSGSSDDDTRKPSTSTAHPHPPSPSPEREIKSEMCIDQDILKQEDIRSPKTSTDLLDSSQIKPEFIESACDNKSRNEDSALAKDEEEDQQRLDDMQT